MRQARTSPGLRPFLKTDAPRLAALARASIETLTEDCYDVDQRAAWSARFDDAGALTKRLSDELALVAVLKGEIVGFAALKGGADMDMLYVAPHFARQGVGSALADALEKLAAARGAKEISVGASDAAREFFLRRGYSARSRNVVQVDGEWLGNTVMTKKLAGSEIRPDAPERLQ